MTSQMPNQHLPLSTVDDDEDVGYDMLVSAEVAAAGRMGLAQGHRCCGRNGTGCCDMRRAVIIVNLVDIAICVFYAIYFAVLAEEVEEIPDSAYEEGGTTKAQMEGMMLKMEHVFIMLSVINVCCRIVLLLAVIVVVVVVEVSPVSRALVLIKVVSEGLVRDCCPGSCLGVSKAGMVTMMSGDTMALVWVSQSPLR